jgi:hypothetical protein
MSNENIIKCNRCGKCCGDCKFLMRVGKITLCRIYHTRLEVEIKTGIYCNKREDVLKNFDGCPYNRPEWA